MNLYLTEDKSSWEKLLIILPPILSSIFVLTLSFLELAPEQTNPMTWLLIVVFIDVAHVWSTLFRTYLSRSGLKKWKNPLWFVPLACYLLGVCLYAFGPRLYWIVLAYFAVFHFIRQQYGLYSLYSQRERKAYQKEQSPLMGKITIYSATLIPLLIWHFSGPQNFFWFVPDDFLYFPNKVLVNVLKVIGPAILIFYLYHNVKRSSLKNVAKSPPVWIILGTYLAWWTGIVWIGTDWSFTITNVIAHGVPYFALIGLLHFGQPRSEGEHDKLDLLWPRSFALINATALVLALAFIEEGLWDALMWRDHAQFFEGIMSFFYNSGPIEEVGIQSFLVPLLALPQATHYALDGLIWRRG